MLVSGITIGILEIVLYLFVSFTIRDNWIQFTTINLFTYCWLTMTVLTGFWEFIYRTNYNSIKNTAKLYITNNEHTWTNQYSLDYILPWKVSEIFYTEYAAYADREYMSDKNIWSRTIEGSHEWCCGLFALFALLSKYYHNEKLYLICISISMGTQFMNSLLYSINYFIQVKDPHNPNYDSPKFPLGFALLNRAFFLG